MSCCLTSVQVRFVTIMNGQQLQEEAKKKKKKRWLEELRV